MQELTTQRPHGIEGCNTDIKFQHDGQAVDERERVVETSGSQSWL